jgi:hypothetical protein
MMLNYLISYRDLVKTTEVFGLRDPSLLNLHDLNHDSDYQIPGSGSVHDCPQISHVQVYKELYPMNTSLQLMTLLCCH